MMQRTGGYARLDLPSPNSLAATGRMATIAGWGSLVENGPYPHLLMHADVPIQDVGVCTQQHGAHWILPGMLCAGFVSGGRDTCQGDSGGPLMVARSAEAGGGWAVVGITSWGLGCGGVNSFAVYSSVSFFYNWVTSHVPELLISPPPPSPPPSPAPLLPPPLPPPSPLPSSPSCPDGSRVVSTCGPLSASQAGLHCSCAYVWQPGCDEPSGVRLHCE